jgi:hypothetical protein
MDYVYVDQCPRANLRVILEGQETGVQLDWEPQPGDHVQLPEDVYQLYIPSQTPLLVDWQVRLMYGNGVRLLGLNTRTDWGWIPLVRDEDIAAESDYTVTFYAWASGYLRLRWLWDSDPGDGNVTWTLHGMESATPTRYDLYQGADIDPVAQDGQWEEKDSTSSQSQWRPYVTAGLLYELRVENDGLQGKNLNLDVGIQSVQRGG